MRINLREVYPFYSHDCFVEVHDDVLKELKNFERKEVNYERRMYRYKAHYSLNRNDGIENDVIIREMTPEEAYERKETYVELCAAFSKLPIKQAKRVFDYYFEGATCAEIANKEGVSPEAVRLSIKVALKRMCEVLSVYGR